MQNLFLTASWSWFWLVLTLETSILNYNAFGNEINILRLDKNFEDILKGLQSKTFYNTCLTSHEWKAGPNNERNSKKLQFLKISSKKCYLKVIIYYNWQLLQCHFLSDGIFLKINSLKVYLNNFEQIKGEIWFWLIFVRLLNYDIIISGSRFMWSIWCSVKVIILNWMITIA